MSLFGQPLTVGGEVATDVRYRENFDLERADTNEYRSRQKLELELFYGHRVEWDVVLGIEEWKHLETEVVGSMFRARRAYGAREGERAFLLILKVDVNF